MALSQAPAAWSPGRQRLTLAQQLKVIDIYHKYKSLGSDEVISRARRAGFVTICIQTVHRYIREEPAIRQYLAENIHHSNRRTRCSSVSMPQVEKALWVWIEDIERRNLRITGEIIKTKARKIAIDMGISPHDMIEFSEGWLTGFKKRYGLKERVFHGEAASAPVHLIEPALKVLHDIIRPFPLEDVINVDETALFSRQARNRGLASRPLPGRKVDKTRLTVVLGTSATGGKLPPFIIGHHARPRAFTNGTPAQCGFWYAHNKTAWMTMELFDGYLTVIDGMAQQAGRRFPLICDNASVHKHNPNKYPNLTIVFLPPNLTSHIQPMDAGIIQSFKSAYQRLLNEHAINLDTQGVADPFKVNQLQSMRMLTTAWNKVSVETITNCWRHTRIIPEGNTVDEGQAVFSQARL
ncbi:tigger transposable element-derived protein [Rhizoctonia solani AG-3 Rhs1AP]|uniref:Tigger transposable element-derived protein n=1 Tax=Rhizoctonia solani AG-3 Rhs1AP TaxID=1086054 RepID=X8J3A9_9AGAM|nr:tigger transposable element-derived protein [Rhizoctonia solani AG-3 Rhs1AP]